MTRFTITRQPHLGNYFISAMSDGKVVATMLVKHPEYLRYVDIRRVFRSEIKRMINNASN